MISHVLLVFARTMRLTISLSVRFLLVFSLSALATQRCRVSGCVMYNGGESRPYEDYKVLFVRARRTLVL